MRLGAAGSFAIDTRNSRSIIAPKSVGRVDRTRLSAVGLQPIGLVGLEGLDPQSVPIHQRVQEVELISQAGAK